MPIEHDRLTVGPIPEKFDRIYKAGDRVSDVVYEVNVGRLQCTCPEWETHRSRFPPDDARRVCAHLYDRLGSTKVERSFDQLARLFIRYGRSMYAYRVIEDELGVMVVGQPFGPHAVRAIGVVGDKPLLATYDVRSHEWSSGETDLSPQLSDDILKRMRATLPDAFK